MNALDRTIQPQAQPIQKLELVKAERSQLSSGAQCYLINAGTQDVCRVELIFNAGARFQQKKLTAKLVAAMLLEGTAGMTGEQISAGLDYHGAFFECKPSSDRLVCTLYCLTGKLCEVLPLFVRAIAGASFPDNEFATQREVALQKFKINEQKVEHLARREFNRLLFPGHIYGEFAGVTDFESIGVSDLKDFHARHITDGGMDVIVSGNIRDADLKIINTVIDNELGAGTLPSLPDDSPAVSSSERIRLTKKDAVQASLAIGRQWFDRTHPDFPQFQVLCTVLGGYFGSRLMSNIREDKGYTYGIHASVVSRHRTGSFTISSQVGGDVAEMAVAEVYKELARLRQEEVPQDELDLVRNYMLGTMLKGFDGPFALADRFKAIHYSSLGYEYYDRYISNVQETTTSRLQELANRYLQQDDLSEVVVGP